jgi:hypothetical protein
MAVTTKKKAKAKTTRKAAAKPASDNQPASLTLSVEVETLTKRYTEDVKYIGEKYGKMLDVKVLITIAEDT